MEDAVQTVMTQCELWTDNYDFETESGVFSYATYEDDVGLVAEEKGKYNK